MAKIFIIMLFIICTNLLCKANDTASNYVNIKLNKSYLLSYVKVCKSVIFFPKYIRHRSHFIILPALIFGAFMADDYVNKKMLNNQNINLTLVTKYGLEPIGDGTGQLGIIALFGGHYLFTKNAQSKNIVLVGTQAFIISGLASQIVKYIAQRERPYKSANAYPYKFNGFWNTQNNRSFYSGHSTTSFALATVIASEYKYKKWVAPLAYFVASAASLSRVYDNKHWLSDVCVGALTGYGIGKLCYWYNNRLHKKLNTYNY